MDSFFYFIEDGSRNALVLRQIRYQVDGKATLAEKELTLQNILISEKHLQLPYQQVNICYSSSKFTIVPDELFNKHDARDYLAQVSNVDDNQIVAYCNLAELKSKIVYGVERYLSNIVKSYFPGANHIHIIAPLIMQGYQIAQHRKEEILFVHVGKNILGTILFKGSKLLLANTFKFENSNDFLYYTLLMFDQFKLNPEDTQLMLSGKIDKRSELFEMIYKYVKNVHFINSPSYYQYGQVFEDVNFHYYQDLLSVRLCV